jgi:hypothetical protein
MWCNIKTFFYTSWESSFIHIFIITYFSIYYVAFLLHYSHFFILWCILIKCTFEYNKIYHILYYILHNKYGYNNFDYIILSLMSNLMFMLIRSCLFYTSLEFFITTSIFLTHIKLSRSDHVGDFVHQLTTISYFYKLHILPRTYAWTSLKNKKGFLLIIQKNIIYCNH